jgi:hypothetical protein
MERLYEVRHRGSRFRGRTVRLLIRPSPRRRPSNVLAECVDSGERFVCPFRGLRRHRGIPGR